MRLRRAPFHEALVSPSLWLGCDPLLLIGLAALSALVGLVGGLGFREPLLCVVGFLLFWLGRKGLLWMAVQDPQLRRERDELRSALGRIGAWSFALETLPAAEARHVLDASRARAVKEEQYMAKLRDGALTLDLYGFRELGQPEDHR